MAIPTLDTVEGVFVSATVKLESFFNFWLAYFERRERREQMKIAVIGAGVAGISVLREVVKYKMSHPNLKIVLFDKEKTFGTGMPYQPDHDALLLNQTPETMSIVPENPYHFVEWLKENTRWTDPIGKHLPRNIYGEYLQDFLGYLLNENNIEVHKNKVEKIHLEEDNRLSIIYGNNKKQVVDAAHLCVGHLPYRDPYELKREEKYIYNPYPVKENLKDIPNHSKIGIIGTGLTAIDLMLYLQEEKEDVDIHFTSLDSSFGAVRGGEKTIDLTYFSKEKIYHERKKNHGFIALETLMNWFKKEVELNGISVKTMWSTYGKGTIEGLKHDLENLEEIGQFQFIIHQLDDLLPEMWESLTEKDKNRFLKSYESKWAKFRSPMPKQTAIKLIDFYEKGKIHLSGPTKNVTKENDLFRIELEEGNSFQVDYVINATGQKNKLSLYGDETSLITQLLNEQLLQKELFGGVQVTWPALSAVNHRYGVLPQLKIQGQLISGIQFGNNTMGMVSLGAIKAVKETIDSKE